MDITTLAEAVELAPRLFRLLGLIGMCQVRSRTGNAQLWVFGEQIAQEGELLPHDALPVHTRVELQVNVEHTAGLLGKCANRLYLFSAD